MNRDRPCTYERHEYGGCHIRTQEFGEYNQQHAVQQLVWRFPDKVQVLMNSTTRTPADRLRTYSFDSSIAGSGKASIDKPVESLALPDQEIAHGVTYPQREKISWSTNYRTLARCTARRGASVKNV